MNNRRYGIYYTALFNPFDNRIFKDWIRLHNLQREIVLEPFAGSNSIIGMLQEIDLAHKYTSYDIYPQASDVERRDTLRSYPTGYSLCITNPPWLYKSSAQRNKYQFPDTKYDDLYKLSLSLALRHNQYVAALLPASFIQSGILQDRLESMLFINRPLFSHTENPVCLALFGEKPSNTLHLYNNTGDIIEEIGEYSELQKLLPKQSDRKLTFNDPDGALGFIAIDNSIAPSIRFCRGAELARYTIDFSSRSITRITINVADSLIRRCNDRVNSIREETNDVFLTAFKGLRKDGKYRRRMSYRLANNIVADCL